MFMLVIILTLMETLGLIRTRNEFKFDEDILVMEGFLNTCDLSENQPPISNAGLGQTVSYSQVVTLDGSQSTDEDGQIVSFLWEQISGTSGIKLQTKSLQRLQLQT